jgi:uncharacterized protein YecE (DUF72 family)
MLFPADRLMHLALLSGRSAMSILVGCSGWSYDDWAGRFYPMELAKKKGEWLTYYAQFFDTVEINSTYYRPPGERQVQSWIKKVKDKPRIKEVELKTSKVRMYFNNHARAKAVRNAFQMMDMLLIDHKSKEIHLQDQYTLGEFRRN